jgi:hypothetical protein
MTCYQSEEVDCLDHIGEQDEKYLAPSGDHYASDIDH